MYDQSSVLIVGLLFAALLCAIEAGYRVGGKFIAAPETARTQVNTIQASLLGVLALLLGFTFSLALQRHDSRSAAVTEEANAIGTAMLRAQLLPEASRPEAERLLTEYVDLRVKASTVSLDHDAERTRLLEAAVATAEALWANAVAAAAADGNPVRTGLYVQALNDMIDAYGTRNAALNRHVPEVVLFLLFGTFLVTAALVGYASGMSAHRTSFATYLLVLLIVLLVFIVIDLDRPRRGLIQVPQTSLLELQAGFER